MPCLQQVACIIHSHTHNLTLYLYYIHICIGSIAASVAGLSLRIRACAQSLRAKDSKANKANKANKAGKAKGRRLKAKGKRSRQLTKQEMMFKDIKVPAYTCRYLYSLACARLCSLKRVAARAAKASPTTPSSPSSLSPSLSYPLQPVLAPIQYRRWKRSISVRKTRLQESVLCPVSSCQLAATPRYRSVPSLPP